MQSEQAFVRDGCSTVDCSTIVGIAFWSLDFAVLRTTIARLAKPVAEEAAVL